MKLKGTDSQRTVVSTIDRALGFGDKDPFILFLTGTLVGRKCRLEEMVTSIGRSKQCRIVVADGRVSRTHSEILLDNKGALLRDAGSTNGTYVNGIRVLNHRLKDGDKIQLSSETLLQFVLKDQTEAKFHDQLYRMAIHDAMTGIFNRRHFDELLAHEFRQALADKTPLSLLLADIDRFKLVNDSHGHPVGDVVLCRVAQLLSSSVRSMDLVARYGGEEFVALLCGTDEEEAKRLAERLRQAVQDEVISHEDVKLSVTVSLGVASLWPDDPFDDPMALLQAADSCLYLSKQAGRNRVTCISEAEDTMLIIPD